MQRNWRKFEGIQSLVFTQVCEGAHSMKSVVGLAMTVDSCHPGVMSMFTKFKKTFSATNIQIPGALPIIWT